MTAQGKILIQKAEELRSTCYSCKKCNLGQKELDGYDPHVFAVGNVNAKIMFIAEAPGYYESVHKKPLVGRSGKLFDEKILGNLGLKRTDVWITNCALCRPPANRKPLPNELDACRIHFDEQFKMIQPKVIIILGATPLNFIAGLPNGITKYAGTIIKSAKYNTDVFALLHPSYILRTGKYNLLEEHVNNLKLYLESNKLL